MFKFVTVFAVSLLTVSVPAQQEPGRKQRILKARLARKLAEPWLKNADWTTSFDEAKARARKEGKPIFAYFTRSYSVCGWCQRCERGPLSEPAFAEFAKAVVPFCHVSSRTGEPYPNLMRAVGGSGHPTIAFLDGNGRVLKLHRGLSERTVAAFRKTLAVVERFRANKKRAADGDGVAKIELVLAEIELGRIRNHEIARSALDECGTPTKGQARRIRTAIANLEVQFVKRRRARNPKRAAKRFAAMLDEGRIPSGTHARFFWTALRAHAKRQGDAALAKRASLALAELGS